MTLFLTIVFALGVSGLAGCVAVCLWFVAGMLWDFIFPKER